MGKLLRAFTRAEAAEAAPPQGRVRQRHRQQKTSPLSFGGDGDADRPQAAAILLFFERISPPSPSFLPLFVFRLPSRFQGRVGAILREERDLTVGWGQ